MTYSRPSKRRRPGREADRAQVTEPKAKSPKRASRHALDEPHTAKLHHGNPRPGTICSDNTGLISPANLHS